MKKAAKIALDWRNSLPTFTPDQKVTHVWNGSYFNLLKSQISNVEISCPKCGSCLGYRVTDVSINGFCGWSCYNSACGITLSRERVFQRQLPSLADCGVQQDLIHADFSRIEQEDESIILKLKDFCKSFLGFLLLPGASGRGKSYASVCCMKKFLEIKEECFFVNVANLYVTWLALKQTGQSELQLVEKYGECELLILDDLGTRTPSESFLDFIYLIINRRVGKPNLGTIISSNLSYQEMSQKLGDAITSRICSGMIVRFSGKDKRMDKF